MSRDDFSYPAWDRVEPLDVYRWRRDRELKCRQTAAMPMMSATHPDGTPLYTMTRSGGWKRTRCLSRSRRRAVLERDSHACIWCGSAERLEIDHIVRYVDGGSDEMSNLRTLCLKCHSSRGGHA